jgi:hypothetical protein
MEDEGMGRRKMGGYGSPAKEKSSHPPPSHLPILKRFST